MDQEPACRERARTTIRGSPRSETGSPALDTRNQRRFRIVNRFIEAFRRGHAKERLTRALDSLIPYTLDPFKSEELWMENPGFPELNAHKAEHMRFATQVADWFECHIKECDQAIAQHLRELTWQKPPNSCAGL